MHAPRFGDALSDGERDALPVDEFLRQQGASQEALRLADTFSPAHTLSDMSTLDVMRKDYAFRWYSKRDPTTTSRREPRR